MVKRRLIPYKADAAQPVNAAFGIFLLLMLLMFQTKNCMIKERKKRTGKAGTQMECMSNSDRRLGGNVQRPFSPIHRSGLYAVRQKPAGLLMNTGTAARAAACAPPQAPPMTGACRRISTV